MAINILKNSRRALKIAAINATAAASGSPKNVMKTIPELITYYKTGK